MTAPAPRCGRPMQRRENTASPGVASVCGRPRGHNGPCRSAGAVRRYYRDDRARQAENAVHAAGWARNGTLCGQTEPHEVTGDAARVTCLKCAGILDGTWKPFERQVTAA